MTVSRCPHIILALLREITMKPAIFVCAVCLYRINNETSNKSLC